ncbi:hypothetical protein ES707_19487 [subsurface metagenome]
MSGANDSETGRVRGKSEAMEEKESQSLRQEFVYRISYVVYREKKQQREKNAGLEANPNASCGRKVSSTNTMMVAGFGGRVK